MRPKILLAVIAIVLLVIGLSIYHTHQQNQCLDQNGVCDAQRHECAP